MVKPVSISVLFVLIVSACGVGKPPSDEYLKAKKVQEATCQPSKNRFISDCWVGNNACHCK